MNQHTAIQKTVMIVDDLEDNRVLLERALQSSGYKTVSFETGKDAISYLAGDHVDIILLDWMMPGLSGYETLCAIRERHTAAELPVIMCTALGEEDNIVDAIAAGANDYVTKPVSLPVLRARMTRHLMQSDEVATLATEKDEAKRKLTEQTKRYFVSRAQG